MPSQSWEGFLVHTVKGVTVPRLRKPEYTCYGCGIALMDYDCVASFQDDYAYGRTRSVRPIRAVCWGCHTGDDL